MVSLLFSVMLQGCCCICRMAEAALRQAEASVQELQVRDQQWVAAAHSRDEELEFLRKQTLAHKLPSFDRSQSSGRVSSAVVHCTWQPDACCHGLGGVRLL